MELCLCEQYNYKRKLEKSFGDLDDKGTPTADKSCRQPTETLGDDGSVVGT